MHSELEVMGMFARLASEDFIDPMRKPDCVIQVLNELGLYKKARCWPDFERRREVIDFLKSHDSSGSDAGMHWLGCELEKYFFWDQFSLRDTQPVIAENIMGRLVHSAMERGNLSVDEACQLIANNSKISSPSRKDIFKVKELKKAYKRWVKKSEDRQRSNTGAFWIPT